MRDGNSFQGDRRRFRAHAPELSPAVIHDTIILPHLRPSLLRGDPFLGSEGSRGRERFVRVFFLEFAEYAKVLEILERLPRVLLVFLTFPLHEEFEATLRFARVQDPLRYTLLVLIHHDPWRLRLPLTFMSCRVRFQ